MELDQTLLLRAVRGDKKDIGAAAWEHLTYFDDFTSESTVMNTDSEKCKYQGKREYVIRMLENKTFICGDDCYFVNRRELSVNLRRWM